MHYKIIIYIMNFSYIINDSYHIYDGKMQRVISINNALKYVTFLIMIMIINIMVINITIQKH